MQIVTCPLILMKVLLGHIVLRYNMVMGPQFSHVLAFHYKIKAAHQVVCPFSELKKWRIEFIVCSKHYILFVLIWVSIWFRSKWSLE